jgi:hypothetical protein
VLWPLYTHWFLCDLLPQAFEGMLDIPHEKPEEDTKKTATVFLFPDARFLRGPVARTRFCRLVFFACLGHYCPVLQDTSVWVANLEGEE